jgi:hypothetical protein
MALELVARRPAVKPWSWRNILGCRKRQSLSRANVVVRSNAARKLELNIFAVPPSYWDGSARMPSKNQRVELEMKIMKYRALARQAPDIETAQRIKELVGELEQRLREIDE